MIVVIVVDLLILILQYTDDLAIFAEGEKFLQTKLDMLQINCKEKK